MTGRTDMTRRRHIVVNADDFGMSSEVNRAILRAFEMRLISSATVMANMPGFSESCDMIGRYDLKRRIGLHLNFTAGRPLTREVAHCGRLCDAQGFWRPRRKVLSLNDKESLALEQEISGQYLACVQNGFKPAHWDSHHHMHTEPGIAPVVIRMAKRLGVRAIRPALNCGPGRAEASIGHRLLARTYREVFNIGLRMYGLLHVDHFADARDAGDLIRTGRSSVELMVHPMPNSRGELGDADGWDLKARMTSLGIMPTEMSCYADLAPDTSGKL